MLLANFCNTGKLLMTGKRCFNLILSLLISLLFHGAQAVLKLSVQPRLALTSDPLLSTFQVVDDMQTYPPMPGL